MSEVIVRMEMPDWCPCKLAIDNNGWFSPCFAYDGIPSREKEFDDCVESRKRPSWCPIISDAEREQHGDLIDRDALKEQFADNGQDIDTLDVIDIINDAPTVIAAERKTE